MPVSITGGRSEFTAEQKPRSRQKRSRVPDLSGQGNISIRGYLQLSTLPKYNARVTTESLNLSVAHWLLSVAAVVQEVLAAKDIAIASVLQAMFSSSVS